MERRHQDLAAGVCGAAFVGSAALLYFWCDGPTILVLPAILVPALATGATAFLSFTDKPLRAVIFATLAAFGGAIAAAVIDLVAGVAGCGLGID